MVGRISADSIDLDGTALVRAALASGFAAPPRVSVSEWADKHRRLPTQGSAEPGPWRTSRVPYTKEIMDCLSPSHPARDICFMKSVQSAGTEVGNNWVGSVIDTQKVPFMVVQPTLDLAETWSTQRLTPMIEDCPTLREKIRPPRERDSGNTILKKKFPGGILIIAGANSGAGLRSMPVRYLMLDEIDAYPLELEKEGNPIDLAEARTTTFTRHKIFRISTPTTEATSQINVYYQESDRRRYYVLCPHCAHKQVLKWEHLHWPPGRPWEAKYACAECGTLIDEHYKTMMLAAGEWRAEFPDRKKVGFHINALYTPIGLGKTWAELAEQYENAGNDRLKQKTFTNLRLGEVSRDPNEKLDAEELEQRAEPRKVRNIPRGCLLLTCGVDVQANRWAVIILGWGRGARCWIIDHFELPGNPTIEADWLELEKRILEPIPNACGIEMRVERIGVDSGYLQDSVLHFVRPREKRGWFAIKGAKTNATPIITRPSRVDYKHNGKTIKGGVNQWQVGTFNAKEWIFSRLVADRDSLPENRAVMFPSGLGRQFYDQLTAEVFDEVRQKFVLIRPRNESLDVFVYGLAAFQHPLLRGHTWLESNWYKREQIYESSMELAANADNEKPAEIKSAAPVGNLSLEEMIKRAKLEVKRQARA